MSPLIKINFDSAEEISALHGIGPSLAAKIVEYRLASGYFQSPADLDKVEGISLKLAETLSPHIDWSIPAPKPPSQEISRSDIATYAAFMLFGLFACYYLVTDAFTVLKGHSMSMATVLYTFSTTMRVMIVLLSCVVGTGILLAKEGDHSAPNRKIYRASYWCLITMSLFIISTWTLLLAHEDLITAEGWRTIFRDRARVATHITMFALLILISPTIVAIHYPRHLNVQLLHRVYDIALFAYALLVNLVLWGGGGNQEVPFITYVGGTINGILLVGLTVNSYRSQKPLFITIAEITGAGAAANQEKDEHWLLWLNTRLPDVEQQKALQRALASAYPTSKFRTILSVAIISAGGWIILTSLGAVIEWVIQKGMDNIAK